MRPTGKLKNGGVDFSNKLGSLFPLILCQGATPELWFDDLTRMVLIDSQICSFPDCCSYSLIIFAASSNFPSFGPHIESLDLMKQSYFSLWCVRQAMFHHMVRLLVWFFFMDRLYALFCCSSADCHLNFEATSLFHCCLYTHRYKQWWETYPDTLL